MTLPTNRAFLKLPRRAEVHDPTTLVETFVEAGPLLTVLLSRDHQILFGRRGTGKTHALYYLADKVRETGDTTVYVDMRVLGSTGGLYADATLPVSERGTRLVADALAAVHDQLLEFTVNADDDESAPDVTALFSQLDDFADAITEVRVEGTVQAEESDAARDQTSSSTEASISSGSAGIPSISLGGGVTESTEASRARRTARMGVERHRVHFGRVTQVLQRLVDTLPGSRTWILLDEWSVVPRELQPLLADLIRRCLMPVRGLTVKIAAIEQRSNFRIACGDSYMGIEIGADASGDVDLDDYLVFGNDATKSKAFFKELLYKHVRAQVAESGEGDSLHSSNSLIQRAFTQWNAFDEFVRAAEGVPRDAINILGLAAQQADDRQVSVNDVRSAARKWYLRDKERAAESNSEARSLLHWIIDEVIGHRRARAFLLQQGQGERHSLIQDLYDSRVLHVVKRGVAAHDRPGVRFDVYSLDYGCYVELITTARAPQGLFQAEAETEEPEVWVDVPADDYRSIRRAILDLSKYEAARDDRQAEAAQS